MADLNLEVSRIAYDVCLCSDQPGWATVVSLSTSCLGTNAPSIQFIPQQCYSETSASFAVDKFHGVTIGPNVSVTVTGPAKSPYGFNLLDMAMSSAGTVVFNGLTQLYDMQHNNTLLATVTGALPGTLQVAVTAAGRPSSLHKSMSGTVTKLRGEQPVIAPPDLWKSTSCYDMKNINLGVNGKTYQECGESGCMHGAVQGGPCRSHVS